TRLYSNLIIRVVNRIVNKGFIRCQRSYHVYLVTCLSGTGKISVRTCVGVGTDNNPNGYCDKNNSNKMAPLHLYSFVAKLTKKEQLKSFCDANSHNFGIGRKQGRTHGKIPAFGDL